MSIQNKKRYAEISLPYFKRGDDLSQCIVKNDNGLVDAKKTLINHIELLQSAIHILQSIHDEIPDNNDIELEGNTHFIGIYGDENIINNLINKNLVEKNDDLEDDSENDLENDLENDSENDNECDCCHNNKRNDNT